MTKRTGTRRATVSLATRVRSIRLSAWVATLSTLAIGVIGFLAVAAAQTSTTARPAISPSVADASARAPMSAATPTPSVRPQIVRGPSIVHHRYPTPAQLTARMAERGYELGHPDSTSSSSSDSSNSTSTTAARTSKTTFRVATFNLLGAKHHRRGFASGTNRVHRQIALLRHHGVSVAGLQEFEKPQQAAFRKQSNWSFYPGGQIQNNVAWNPSVWTFVKGGTTPIPYFGGHPVRMPHVLLQNKTTGQKMWFASYHNPADTRGPAGGARVRAIHKEAKLFKRLTKSGTPMIVTGDMNDRRPFACPFTKQSGARSADNAYFAGRCHTPKRMNVDWLMGSTKTLDFSGFNTDFSSKRKHISDHPLVTSSVAVPASSSSSADAGEKKQKAKSTNHTSKDDCVTKHSTLGQLLFCRA